MTRQGSTAVARSASLMGDLLKGAVAGAAATWAMDRVTGFFEERESRRALRRERRARGGSSPAEQGAEKLAEAVGAEPDRRFSEVAGRALHWTLGAGSGAVYGVLRRRLHAVGRARGLGFGAGFFLFVDETVVPLLGLSPAPGAFPWQTHVRGLSGHLVFGTVADAVFVALDRLS